MELGAAQAPLRLEHLPRPLEDALALSPRSGHHPGIVGQKDDRQVEGPGGFQKVRRLDGGGAVQSARPHRGVVRQNRHRVSAQEREGGDERGAIGRLDLEQAVRVYQRLEHGVHLVGLAVVRRDDLEDPLEHARGGVRAGTAGCRLPAIERKVGQVAAR